MNILLIDDIWNTYKVNIFLRKMRCQQFVCLLNYNQYRIFHLLFRWLKSKVENIIKAKQIFIKIKKKFSKVGRYVAFLILPLITDSI